MFSTIKSFQFRDQLSSEKMCAVLLSFVLALKCIIILHNDSQRYQTDDTVGSMIGTKS